MSISPIKYPKLNKIDVTVLSANTTSMVLNIDITPINRLFVGKKVYFLYNDIVYYGTYVYQNDGTTKSYYLNNLSDTSIILEIVDNTIIQVLDTFSIIDDNELITQQDILDIFVAGGNNYSLLNYELVENYLSTAKDGLLNVWDKTKLDTVPFLLKSNNIQIGTDHGWVELINLKSDFTADLINREYTIFLRDWENNILVAGITFATLGNDYMAPDNIMFKVKNCSFKPGYSLDFRFEKTVYSNDEIFTKVEVRLEPSILQNEIIQVYFGITNIKDIQIPVGETVTSTELISFNNGDTSFNIDGFVSEVNINTKKTLGSGSSVITITPTITLGGFTKDIEYAGKTNEELWNILLRPYVAGSYSVSTNYAIAETGATSSGSTVVEKGYYASLTSLNLSVVADSNGDILSNVSFTVLDPAGNPPTTSVFLPTYEPIVGANGIPALNDVNQNRFVWNTSTSTDTWKIFLSGTKANGTPVVNELVHSLRFYDIALVGIWNSIINAGNAQQIFNYIRSNHEKRICTTKVQQYVTTTGFDTEQYGYIIYPSVFGNLTSIKQNNAEEQFNSWVDCGTFDYTNPKGLITNMKVYRTSVPKAYQAGQTLYCS